MKIDTQEIFDFLAKPPKALVESFIEKDMTPHEVQEMFRNFEVLVCNVMAHKRLKEYQTTEIKKVHLTLHMGGLANG